jgi:hypothetical protein
MAGRYFTSMCTKPPEFDTIGANFGGSGLEVIEKSRDRSSAGFLL